MGSSPTAPPKVPVILQSEAPECGIACLAMVASYHGHRTDLSAMRAAPLAVAEGHHAQARRADRRDDGHDGARRAGAARVARQAPAARDPALGHEPLRGAREGLGQQDHGARPGARQARADARRGVAALHRRGDGVHADRRHSRRRTSARRSAPGSCSASPRASRGRSRRSCCCRFALEVFAIAMPFFLQLTVDRVLVGRDRDLLTVLGIAFGVLVVIQVAVTAVRAWVGVYLSTNINLQAAHQPLQPHAAPAARVVREEEHRRHRLEVPQRGRDPAHAHHDLRRDRGGRRDGGAHARS